MLLTTKEIKQTERYKRFLIAMIDKGLTQDDLAAKLGCHKSFVCMLLMGYRKSRAKTKQLCEILDIRVEEVQ